MFTAKERKTLSVLIAALGIVVGVFGIIAPYGPAITCGVLYLVMAAILAMPYTPGGDP